MSSENINAASVTYNYGENESGIAISNSADFIHLNSVNLEKSCLSQNYFPGDCITYIIDIKNNSDIPVFGLKIKESMGISKDESSSGSYSPLKYTGIFRYYLNGNNTEILDPKVYSDKIIFEIDTLPALSNASIIYSAKITESAPLKTQSYITNKSSLIIPTNGKTLESSNTLKVKEIADIKTVKHIKNFCENGVTYTISIYNYGNIPAENIMVKDKFERKFSNLNIKINSKNLNTSDYIYNSDGLQIPSYGSKYSISVPEAKFIRDETSGKFSIIPGIVELIIDCKV